MTVLNFDAARAAYWARTGQGAGHRMAEANVFQDEPKPVVTQPFNCDFGAAIRGTSWQRLGCRAPSPKFPNFFSNSCRELADPSMIRDTPCTEACGSSRMAVMSGTRGNGFLVSCFRNESRLVFLSLSMVFVLKCGIELIVVESS